MTDVERAVELARRAKDPQNIFQTFATASAVFQEAGDPRAEPLAREFLDAVRSGTGLGFAVVFLHVLSWPLTELGSGPELAEAVADLELPWARAAAAYGRGDPVAAAEICAEIGAVAEEAHDRLHAAKALAADGRRAEADVQLRRALAFYRSVGATRYVREGEALLTASA